MDPNDQSERYKSAYARLLRLFPKSHQTQFAEPMQQMFVDMCNERIQAGEDMLVFMLKTYADTLLSIARARTSDLSTNIRENRLKVLLGIGGLGIVAIAPAVILLNNRPAQSISPFSYFEQTRELSKGRKDACLSNNKQAMDAIKNDDSIIQHDGNQTSKFDTTASTGIIDIPATTNYEITKNSYQDGVAKGTIAYEKDYGAYNYIIEKQPEAGQWLLVSIIACKQ